jgi:hypothetical protein
MLAGVLLVKMALELAFALWVMSGLLTRGMLSTLMRAREESNTDV